MELQNRWVLAYEGWFGFHWVANTKKSRPPVHSEPIQHKYWRHSVALNVWISKDIASRILFRNTSNDKIFPSENLFSIFLLEVTPVAVKNKFSQKLRSLQASECLQKKIRGKSKVFLTDFMSFFSFLFSFSLVFLL